MRGMGFTQTNQEWPSGVTHGRIWDIGATWKDLHLAPGVFDWSRLDEVIAKMKENGINHITYVIAATPAWAAQDPNAPHYAPWLGPGSNSLPGDPNNSWKPFVWEISDRYKGVINAYEVWNECQLKDFMYPWDEKNRKALAKMTDDANRIIKGNDPKALVGACSILPRETSGGLKKGEKFLNELAKRKNWGGVDFFAIHSYPEGSTKQASQWIQYFDDTKALLKKLKAPKNEGKSSSTIWVTETALGLLSGGISEDKVNQYTDKIAERGAGKVFWYAWDREDLGGAWIGPGTYQWEAIKRNWS